MLKKEKKSEKTIYHLAFLPKDASPNENIHNCETTFLCFEYVEGSEEDESFIINNGKLKFYGNIS